MGAYLHQDFALGYGDDLGAVDAFLVHEPGMRDGLVSDLVEALELYPTRGEMTEHLLQRGCAYYPSRFDGDFVAWLAALRDHVAPAEQPEMSS
jgi:hypothetical protein